MSKWHQGRSSHNLSPTLQYLSDQAILVQAWKKAHEYIRLHNWYADSLELDVSAIQLQENLGTWAQLLRASSYRQFIPDDMRIVPAPKNASWDMSDGWKPTDVESPLELRPLAHLSIRDQTLSMAFLLCLANIIETFQGNPETDIEEANRQGIVSYGHRLVCSWNEEEARFGWGNARLYRQYYTDYQTFVQRAEVMREKRFADSCNWAIVQADLSRFYDNVNREVLIQRLVERTKESLGSPPDRHFFDAMGQVFAWSWHPHDEVLASECSESSVSGGLPQGLAASGFFANAYLLDFDERIVQDFNKKNRGREWRVIDYCRYVDDMRFLIEVPEGLDSGKFEDEFHEYLSRRLKRKAPGLSVNPEKTQVKRGDTESTGTPMADTMQAIERDVSGPLDVATARQALDQLDGLLASSTRRSRRLDIAGTGQDEDLRRILSPEPDVRSETVERFTAHRWRRVYRSLRVMSDAEGMQDSPAELGTVYLDHRAEAFATELIHRWIQNPSKVRLLRVAMDIYPDPEHLDVVLKLLDAYLARQSESHERKVAAYVAAELLRAGATETGLVSDDDELPKRADVEGYRERLKVFATERLANANNEPWYLVQQAMLFLAVVGHPLPAGTWGELTNGTYGRLHEILNGQWPLSSDGEEASIADTLPLILAAHHISGDCEACAVLIAGLISDIDNSEVRDVLQTVLTTDDSLIRAVWEHMNEQDAAFWQEHFITCGYLPNEKAALEWQAHEESTAFTPLLTIITSASNPFRQETVALRLLDALLREWPRKRKDFGGGILTPSRIEVKCSSWKKVTDPSVELSDEDFQIRITSANGDHDHRYQVPSWCPNGEKWRIETGQIVRAAVVGKPDCTLRYRPPQVVQGLKRYRSVGSTWFKRKHGLFSGRSGLGDRFLSVSPWLTELLWSLLAWPGTEPATDLANIPRKYTVSAMKRIVAARLAALSEQYCYASNMPCYEYPLRLPGKRGDDNRLRVAVVQSVMPQYKDFEAVGVELSQDAYRRKHRRHVTAMLRLVQRILEIREGYRESEEHVDLVVFPELAVHSDDLGQLVRFADATKCMVFSGLVFHPHPHHSQHLINSGVWILPIVTHSGRSIHLIEQGKFNLTKKEEEYGIESFRPCQWLVKGRTGDEPWRITATLCYDATDLRLASDMRDLSDAFIISAANRDIGTFDTMASALHYHMYQHLILANTGEFGGTTVQAPYKAPYKKVIVHHHGMDEVLVSVFDIDLLEFRSNRTQHTGHSQEVTAPLEDERKHPPAGFGR